MSAGYNRRVDSTPSPGSAPRVAVLGPVLVEDRAGRLAEPAGLLGKSLIVALALARGSHSVSSLVEDLWVDAPPRQERAALQTLVSRVRTASADGLLESTPSGYALALGPEGTDLGIARLRLERARAAEAAGDPDTAVEESTAALALWRGEPGAELGGTPLAAELCRTASALRDDLLLVRARANRRRGDATAALADLEPLLAARPLDEALQLERMRALAEAGRRSEALLVFAEVREALLERLGTRPGAALVALNAQLLAEDAEDAEDTEETEDAEDAEEPAAAATTEAASSRHDEHRPGRPTAAPVSPAPHRIRLGLRAAPNALIGREYDLEAVEDLVATSRLTTVLGAGGLGKTRLAQEIGHRAIHTPAVVFVELASVRSGEDIELAFASTLGIRESRTKRQLDPGAQLDLRSRILGLLSERATLLIVDNCEHIVDAAAAYIADILESTASVRVLATSRAPLAISAEHVYPLDSLASRERTSTSTSASADTGTSTPYGPAVALFMERARAARPGVVLPVDAVARLCDRLDGLPLAIELAAARTRSLSVEEIERRLGNRFALLTGGERTAPERHRTLLAVIDWSWNLLSGREQTLLRRLSRFPDGFSAEAAEAVAGPGAATVLDDLEALVNQSLVSVTEDGVTGILRYRMLETVREFGDRELVAAGEADEVRAGMDAWAIAFCSEAMLSMYGPGQVPTFLRVTAEQDNLVAVLRSALQGRRLEAVAAVFGLLSYYWSLRSAHSEVLSFGPEVLDALGEWRPEGPARDHVAVCLTLIGGTFLYTSLRTSARAASRLRHLHSGRPFGDARLECFVALLLTVGREGPVLRLLEEYCSSADPGLAAMGNLIRAQVQENEGDLDEGLETARRSYEKGLEAEDTWTIASAAQALAQLHSQLAHPREALEWARRAYEGLAELQAAGDLRQLDWLIAANSIASGDLERGREVLDRYLAEEVDRTGFDYVDYYGIGYGGLAEIALAQGDLAEGTHLYHQAVGVYTGDDAAQRETVMNPWLTILTTAQLAARLRAHAEDPGLLSWTDTDEEARRLRLRVLVNVRLSPPYIDKPVVGTGLLGYALWMLDPHTAARHDGAWADAGLTLFALSARTNSRQDIASLHREPLTARVREAWGGDRLEEALAATAGLSRDDAARRGLELLGRMRPA